MAKVTILGNAVVVTSSVKLEDIKTVSKYNADALVLKGGEDGKEPVFAVCATRNTYGELGTYGAAFGSANADGFATITMTIDDPEDAKEYIAEKFGGALANLAKVEKTLPEVVAVIKAQKDEVLESITVVG